MMLRLELLLSFSVFLSPFSAFAGSAAISFYRTPQSLFASGQTSERALQKNWVKDTFQFTFLVNKDHRQFWVDADQVATDIDLSSRVRTSSDQSVYHVLQWNHANVLAENIKTKEKKIFSTQALQPDPADLGLAMTLIETQIRAQPEWKSPALLTLPAKTKLQLLRLTDSWAQVALVHSSETASTTPLGYIDVNNLLLKMDFASFVLVNKTWLPFHHRDGEQVFVSDSRSVQWKEVQGILTKPHFAISLSVDDAKHLLLRQNLEILKTQPQIWKISELPGHGLVYWAEPSMNEPSSPATENGEVLTTDQLLHREVTSVAFHPQNSKFGLASAEGIFFTKDGEHWKKLEQFQKQNQAVSIDNKGRLYVGGLRSQNLGQSFEPYFRWDFLASMVETHLKSPSHELRLDSISFSKKNILQIEVSNGSQKIRLAARNDDSLITHWDLN